MMVIQILFERGRVFRERAGPPSLGTPSTLASGESPWTPAGQVGLPPTKITRTEPIHQNFYFITIPVLQLAIGLTKNCF